MNKVIITILLLTACKHNSDYTWIGIASNEQERSCAFHPATSGGGRCIANSREYKCIVDDDVMKVSCVPEYSGSLIHVDSVILAVPPNITAEKP